MLLVGDRLIVVSSCDEPVDRTGAGDDMSRTAVPPLPIFTDIVDEHLAVVGRSALGTQLLEGWAASAPPKSTIEIFYDGQFTDPPEVTLPDLPVPARITPLNQLSDVLSGQRSTTMIVLGSW